MNTLNRLEQMLFDGEITEDEFKEKKETYVELLLDLYINDIITKEQLYKKLNGYEI